MFKSAPESKAQVRYCDHAMSVIHPPFNYHIFYLCSETSKCVFIGQICQQKWLPWSLIGWDNFDFSANAKSNLTTLVQKQVLNVIGLISNKDRCSYFWLAEHLWLFLCNCWMEFETRQCKVWHPLAGGHIWPWPLTLWPKTNRDPPLIMNNLHVKCESDWAKTVVWIVPAKFYRQSAKVDLDLLQVDLWPCDPKSIETLLSLWTSYMWSLKVIGQKL